MIHIVEYSSHIIFGFIGIKNRATPNRDIDQANGIEKPFHVRLLILLKVVVVRHYLMKGPLFSQIPQHLSIFVLTHYPVILEYS